MEKQMENLIVCKNDSYTETEIMAKALIIMHKTLKEKEEQIAFLELENEILEIALQQSLRFLTVIDYNKIYKMDWDTQQCLEFGKALTGFCRANKIEIRTCKTNDERFTQVNSYPLTAWELFMNQNFA